MAFFRKRNPRSETYKAVYSVSIDTNSEYRGDGYSDKINRREPACLVPGGEYCFGKQEKFATYDDLKEFAIKVLNDELRDECEQFIDIPITDIKVRSIYEGSIELFFTVVFGVVASIAGIKDLYDSIDFLRSLAEKKLMKRFREKYGDYFRIDVSRQIPRETRYYDECGHFHKHENPYRHQHYEVRRKRDGFFWYLLISNLVLLAVVMALVANAIIKVYF